MLNPEQNLTSDANDKSSESTQGEVDQSNEGPNAHENPSMPNLGKQNSQSDESCPDLPGTKMDGTSFTHNEQGCTINP
jgi:hypothetical protein